ncbi:efflux RND transporter periplasmic adaptor subunit [Algoriphagus sp.]|uniref:efflux RND transporter periplasmic adaptor subunit n=1 Tax=Algoriphagus sp. TaxID=1872435 RepID=UPI0025D3D1AF|nr:efflux RND transporter periplasmic adaptor subunit [Algoriphagus sp.]
MKSFHLYSYLIIGSLLISSCGVEEKSSEKNLKGDTIPVTVLKLNKDSFSTSIPASGNWTTKDETILSFKVGGIVSKVYVEEGDEIKKGQLLASLNLTELEAGLSQAKIAFEKAKRDYERASKLYQDSVATLEQKQNSETALQIAGEQLKAVEFNFQFAQIRASQNGFVLRKFINEGQQVFPGNPILQTNGAKDDSWVLEVAINDLNWTQIAEGDSAHIELGNDPEEFVKGKVVRKSQSADPRTGAFTLEISPEKSGNLNLASGMFGRAKIFPSKQANGWEIPYEALLDADGKEGFVFVTKDQSTALKVPVKIGKISNETVQVLSGLDEFPFLIVSGSAYLTNESAIKIN